MQPSVRINLLFQPRRWSIFVFFFTGDILCKASQLSESQVRPVSVHSSATYQDRYLAGFVIKSLQLDDWLQCLMTCESFPECISYNFNPRLRRCDINSRGITGSKGQQCLGEESLIFSQDSIFQQIKGRCTMNFAFFFFFSVDFPLLIVEISTAASDISCAPTTSVTSTPTVCE